SKDSFWSVFLDLCARGKSPGTKEILLRFIERNVSDLGEEEQAIAADFILNNVVRDRRDLLSSENPVSHAAVERLFRGEVFGGLGVLLLPKDILTLSRLAFNDLFSGLDDSNVAEIASDIRSLRQAAQDLFNNLYGNQYGFMKMWDSAMVSIFLEKQCVKGQAEWEKIDAQTVRSLDRFVDPRGLGNPYCIGALFLLIKSTVPFMIDHPGIADRLAEESGCAVIDLGYIYKNITAALGMPPDAGTFEMPVAAESIQTFRSYLSIFARSIQPFEKQAITFTDTNKQCELERFDIALQIYGSGFSDQPSLGDIFKGSGIEKDMVKFIEGITLNRLRSEALAFWKALEGQEDRELRYAGFFRKVQDLMFSGNKYSRHIHDVGDIPWVEDRDLLKKSLFVYLHADYGQTMFTRHVNEIYEHIRDDKKWVEKNHDVPDWIEEIMKERNSAHHR
ncbi:MAG: hypothetical protein AABZ57_01775, partial [Candidatus Margulisiibacteriota bacterium]